MRNIVERVGATNFKRIRIGFNDGSNIPLLNFVLSGIKKEYYPIFAETVALAGEAATAFAKGEKFDDIMQKYNRVAKK
jgi:peptidyl-tRNA hydrolase